MDVGCFCKLLSETTRGFSGAEPLRFRARRKAPLKKAGETLGHLEVLLRLRFHGEGRGTGILVFEWPNAAEEHSVVRNLEGWSARCKADPRREDSLLELERREVTTRDESSTPIPATHLEVRFPLSNVPEEMFEPIDLALRVGLGDLARDAIERGLERKATVHAMEPRKQAPPTPRNGVAGSQKQTKIDAIAANSVFDPAVHPSVALNTQVTNSDGVSFRLVVRRARGRTPKHVWIKIPSSVARASS